MQIANIRLVLNAEGTDVQRKNVTPAEATLLRTMFEGLVRSNPVTLIEIVKGGNDEPAQAAVIVSRDHEDLNNSKKFKLRPRTNIDEIRRLKNKYDAKFVEKLFPGVNPSLPATFEDAGFEENLSWQEPSKLAKGSIHARPRGPQTDDEFIFMDVPDDVDMNKLVAAE